MELKKEFVKNCRKIGVLQEFLCQAIDQIDNKDKQIENIKKEKESALKAVSHWHDHYCQLQTKIDHIETKLVMKTDKIREANKALWLARANRAHAEWGHWATIWFCNTSAVLNINKSSVSQDPYRCTIQRNAAIWRNIWNEVERKCRAKAKEFV